MPINLIKIVTTVLVIAVLLYVCHPWVMRGSPKVSLGKPLKIAAAVFFTAQPEGDCQQTNDKLLVTVRLCC